MCQLCRCSYEAVPRLDIFIERVHDLSGSNEEERDRPEHVHFASWCHGHVVRAVCAVMHDVFEGGRFEVVVVQKQVTCPTRVDQLES